MQEHETAFVMAQYPFPQARKSSGNHLGKFDILKRPQKIKEWGRRF
jgi:hypothetical protein